MGSIDLSHHINTLSKSRRASPLKDMLKYMYFDGMVSLAGGLPHPSLFPFANLQADVYAPNASLENDLARPQDLVHLNIDKFAKSPEVSVDLATTLQYSASTGSKWLSEYSRTFTELVYQPGYKNFDTLMHSGNTDAWQKVIELLCEAGEYLIVERHTYPSAQALWTPMGCKGVPVEIDGEGMCPVSLEETLLGWDVTHPGIKRPHVLYTVPTGQNPTGSTIPAKRKEELYAICSKYDLIIIEDDPYYFLQFDQYVHGHSLAFSEVFDKKTFLQSLEKTFLHFDTEGRVIRLDSFSKTIAPGSRLGWFTANPVFCERLLRATEVTTLSASGFSQAILAGLLQTWGLDGHLTWLSRMKEVYRVRRTWVCDAIATSFDVEADGPEAAVAYLKGTRTKIFSFTPPRAGMFLWCKMHLDENKDFLAMKDEHEDPEAAYETKLWMQLVEEKVLVIPGSYYTPWEGKGARTTSAAGGQSKEMFFRVAYSLTTKEDMALGIRRMAMVYARAWGP